jgi:hypothetical protein
VIVITDLADAFRRVLENDSARGRYVVSNTAASCWGRTEDRDAGNQHIAGADDRGRFATLTSRIIEEPRGHRSSGYMAVRPPSAAMTAPVM